jgi:hypothetical protein
MMTTNNKVCTLSKRISIGMSLFCTSCRRFCQCIHFQLVTLCNSDVFPTPTTNPTLLMIHISSKYTSSIIKHYQVGLPEKLRASKVPLSESFNMPNFPLNTELLGICHEKVNIPINLVYSYFKLVLMKIWIRHMKKNVVAFIKKFDLLVR